MKTCQHGDCGKQSGKGDSYCNSHSRKVTVERFLKSRYSLMRERVTGKSGTKRPDLYVGKSILSKEEFINWALNRPEFMDMYNVWYSSNFDRKLTPSINRINSAEGYVLGNIEWLTNSANCGLSGMVRKNNAQRNLEVTPENSMDNVALN